MCSSCSWDEINHVERNKNLAQPTWIKIALKSNVEEPQEYISLPDPYSHFNLM